MAPRIDSQFSDDAVIAQAFGISPATGAEMTRVLTTARARGATRAETALAVALVLALAEKRAETAAP